MPSTLPPASPPPARHIGQKVALVSAIFCAAMILPALIGFFWVWAEYGLADPLTPSLLATIAFFACCAGVLYVTSRPQPPLPQEEVATSA
jgi:hypothetical protein